MKSIIKALLFFNGTIFLIKSLHALTKVRYLIPLANYINVLFIFKEKKN